MFDYYCRILSGHDNHESKVDNSIYQQALANLSLFDVRIRLEEGLDGLCSDLGWQKHNVFSNKTSSNKLDIIKRILRAKFKLAYLRFKYPKRQVENSFKDFFIKQNKWDIALYRSCIELENNLEANR